MFLGCRSFFSWFFIAIASRGSHYICLTLTHSLSGLTIPFLFVAHVNPDFFFLSGVCLAALTLASYLLIHYILSETYLSCPISGASTMSCSSFRILSVFVTSSPKFLSFHFLLIQLLLLFCSSVLLSKPDKRSGLTTTFYMLHLVFADTVIISYLNIKVDAHLKKKNPFHFSGLLIPTTYIKLLYLLNSIACSLPI